MHKVVVIGAGIAGLTAALTLQDAGVSVEVLDAAARPGGRFGSFQRDGATVDTGSQFIGPRDLYKNSYALLNRLGLAESIEKTSDTAALIRGGKVHAYRYHSAADFLKLPVLSLAAKMRLMAVYPELKRHRAQLDFHHLEKAADLDDRDIGEFLAPKVGQDALDHLVMPLVGAFYHYPRQGVSRAFMMAVAGSLNNLGTYALRGGNASLLERLAGELHVRPLARVTRVEARAEGRVLVRWRSPVDASSRHQIQASAAVVAIPASDAAEICTSVVEKAFLDSVEYIPYAAVAFGVHRRLGGRVYGAAIAADESPLLGSVTFEENKCSDRAPAGTGLTVGVLNASAAKALRGNPRPELIAEVGAELERLWPGHAASIRWSQLIYEEQAAPFFGVGSIRRLKEFLSLACGGISYCGDYLVGPHLEGAITAGLRSSHEVLSWLNSSEVRV